MKRLFACMLLCTCCIQVDCIFGAIVGAVVGFVGSMLGLNRPSQQISFSVGHGIDTLNGNVANSLSNLDKYVKNDIIPELKKMSASSIEIAESAKNMSIQAQAVLQDVRNILFPKAVETMDAAQNMMENVAHSVNEVGNAGVRVLDNVNEKLIPEASLIMQIGRWAMMEFVNMSREMQEQIGRSLINLEYVSGIIVAMCFIGAGLLSGYALRQIEFVLKPSGFVVLEIYVLKWIRLVTYSASFLMVLLVILKILQITIFSRPDYLLFFLLFPILSVFSYHLLCFILWIFQYVCIGLYHLYLFCQYLLFVPYFILYYSALFPFVLTYNCYVNRHNHRNRIGVFIILCFPMIFSFFYFTCIDVMDQMLKAKTEKEYSLPGQEYYSITWVYSAFVNFLLFYGIALVLRFCYKT